MQASARNQAMDLLARREHSARELRHKLARRGFGPDEIEQALEGLQADGLQSDARFAEDYCRSRIGRGFGPLRIRAELGERGVAGSHVEAALAAEAADWHALAAEAWQRRFGVAPADRREQARQQRFLLNRGFPGEVVRALVARAPDTET